MAAVKPRRDHSQLDLGGSFRTLTTRQHFHDRVMGKALTGWG